MKRSSYRKMAKQSWYDLTSEQQDDLYYVQEVQEIIADDLETAVSEVSENLIAALESVGLDASSVEIEPELDSLYFNHSSSCYVTCENPEMFIDAVVTGNMSPVEMDYSWGDAGLGGVVAFYNEDVLPKLLDVTKSEVEEYGEDPDYVEEELNLTLEEFEDRFAQLVTDHINEAYGYEHFLELGEEGLFDSYIYKVTED